MALAVDEKEQGVFDMVERKRGECVGRDKGSSDSKEGMSNRTRCHSSQLSSSLVERDLDHLAPTAADRVQ
jgi:hypothetical protein